MKKRRLKKGVKFVLSIILLAVVATFVFFKVDVNKLLTTKTTTTTTTTTTNPIKEYHASLIAVGDGLIHDKVYKAAYNKETDTYDFSNMLTLAKDKIKDYDIKYYNQEVISDPEKNYSTYPQFNCPKAFMENMLDAGFNTVSLATNHSMDRGVESALRHAAWYEDKKDILAVGMATSMEKRNEFKVMNANGITYTMLNYTYGTNGLGIADINKSPYLVNMIDKEQIKKDIEAARDKVDVLIVAMHWGLEYHLEPNSTQKDLAKFLADNGVDIVIGTHSHCIEPIEVIGDTVVFYSLGNFISDQVDKTLTPFGIFGTLDINKTVDTRTNETTITIDNIGAEIHYTKITADSNSITGKNYQVIPFSKINANILSDYKSQYDKYYKVLTSMNDSVKVEPIN